MISPEELVFGKSTLDVSSDEETPVSKPKPAWIDPDDAQLMIAPEKARMLDQLDPVSGEKFANELAERYHRTTEHIDTSWADISKATGRVIDADSIYSSSTKYLPSERIVITRRADLVPLQDPTDKKNSNRGLEHIKQIAPHPFDHDVALLGKWGTISRVTYTNESSSALFRIPVADNIYRTCITYSKDGSKLFVGCTQGRFQVLDAVPIKGKHSINVYQTGSRNDIVAVSASETMVAFITRDSVYFYNESNLSPLKAIETSEKNLICGSFTDDGKFFVVAGSEGRGHVIDCEKSNIKSVAVFQVEDMQTITALDVRGDYVAMGNDKGFLYVFEFDSLRISPIPGKLIRPKEIIQKANIVTAINEVRFNPTAEILLFASSSKEGALRLLHISSKTVFGNWPTQKTPLKHVASTSFSADSEYLALANGGKVTMWELGHYSSLKKEEEKEQ
ncbi:hypothetical protein TVAG_230750 [Trichomonas vaginalis G3]|uniref:Anaphase-promoting complex subunit 4 WD40 domain-containing protein n=1 Tax=Trichomonas vaginalis (strain ATCC PRA-98 / G3) TaxID=412133 RepID=A2EE03_TRIV3|nr:maturation of SSU-rRNA from tricistronic rRNA transcript (SSU-rRNA, 5.8S rRNA, LSU-rRNA) [Trichomonas vaginalis G3]EAY09115.1 hypothetical protein TVAG_230750 [Trichomonas vaginalis G3]KAI5502653.1 maturation of SSU-rRNA from tricistronic rRNA transcript (SSU-rRNA, 5.8S rRNA, LSU-rRNA) [Trichomonas vaginalis G3]|eukprot:XP_001321338.1 hypothetical protein [Trichomonas vaginalis G3]